MANRWGVHRSTGAIVVGLALVATACTGSTDKEAGPPSTAVERPTKGGTLVLGAAQEPACADWYGSCGNSSWGRDMMGSQTLPRAFDFVDGQYRPSVLLVGDPRLEVGPPQRVTYRIDPRAVWSDGQPITSSDFKYTAELAKATAFSTASASVDTVLDSDPNTAIVTFTEPTAAWRDNFLFVLPKHLLDGKDRAAEMRNGYAWSGGPWLIDHWTKGAEIKLVPNPTYWGPKPNLDAAVFKVITDSAAYVAAYKTGQLDMAFVQGAQLELADLKSLPDTTLSVNVGFTYEFLMFNTLKPPLDHLAVRQALAYASDRDAIVTQLSGALVPGIKPAQAFVSPGNPTWYSEPFKKYGRDLAKVTQLMTSDGWSKGSDGIWAKAGTRAVVELNTASGNRRRELAEQILQSQWKEAGFEASINNPTSATLLGEWVPKGIFQIALFGFAPSSTDPNHCRNFCTKFTPTEANGYQGGDVSRLSSPAIDDAWQAVTSELDQAKRMDLVRRGQQALADELPGLPLSPVVDVVIYNSSKVGGLKLNPVGAFYNLSEWYCRARCGS